MLLQLKPLYMVKTSTKLILILLAPLTALAQVDEIKSASSKLSGGGRYTDFSRGGSGFAIDLFVNLALGGVIETQKQRLEQKHEVPGMVSFDVILQTAAQPSRYYIVNPRVRANWGLFSTDFRINYLIQESIDGRKYLQTNDWQVIQFNFVTTKDITFRMGAGIMQEAYNDRHSFTEWTAALQVLPNNSKIGGAFEYRSATPRNEVSAQALVRALDYRKLHSFFSVGAIYQRYYRSVTTWGFQGGLILRFY